MRLSYNTRFLMLKMRFSYELCFWNTDTLKKIYGTDIDEKILEVTKERFADYKIKTEFIYADWNSSFLIPEKVDIISMIAVVEHVFDPEKIVRNAYNWLNDWGLFIVQVPNIVVLQRRIAFLFGIRPRTSWDNGWDGWHIAYFTKSDLENLLQRNWFKIQKITWSWIFANMRNWWVSLLSPDIIILAEK